MPQVVRSNAFYHVPSLAKLNLSGNKIYKIEDLAFKVNIGDSTISHGSSCKCLFFSLTVAILLSLSIHDIPKAGWDAKTYIHREYNV